jgi:hypothetical protein
MKKQKEAKIEFMYVDTPELHTLHLKEDEEYKIDPEKFKNVFVRCYVQSNYTDQDIERVDAWIKACGGQFYKIVKLPTNTMKTPQYMQYNHHSIREVVMGLVSLSARKHSVTQYIESKFKVVGL